MVNVRRSRKRALPIHFHSFFFVSMYAIVVSTYSCLSLFLDVICVDTWPHTDRKTGHAERQTGRREQMTFKQKEKRHDVDDDVPSQADLTDGRTQTQTDGHFNFLWRTITTTVRATKTKTTREVEVDSVSIEHTNREEDRQDTQRTLTLTFVCDSDGQREVTDSGMEGNRMSSQQEVVSNWLVIFLLRIRTRRKVRIS